MGTGARSAQSVNRAYFKHAYQTGVHGWGVDVPDPRMVELLRSVRREYPGGRLLDMGCGEGRHSIAAAAMGFQVTAVDFEPLALRRARRFAKNKHALHIVFRKAHILRLPFAPESFDLVLDAGCLHHQLKRDWPLYKRNLLRVLRPGGAYLLSVFSPHFRFFRETNRPWHIARGAYRRCFTRQDLRELFSRDFQIVSLKERRGPNGGFWYARMKRRARVTASP